jgi:hypothetical protein
MTFVVSENMDGRIAECRTAISADASVDPVSETTAPQVGSGT